MGARVIKESTCIDRNQNSQRGGQVHAASFPEVTRGNHFGQKEGQLHELFINRSSIPWEAATFSQNAQVQIHKNF